MTYADVPIDEFAQWCASNGVVRRGYGIRNEATFDPQLAREQLQREFIRYLQFMDRARRVREADFKHLRSPVPRSTATRVVRPRTPEHGNTLNREHRAAPMVDASSLPSDRDHSF